MKFKRLEFADLHWYVPVNGCARGRSLAPSTAFGMEADVGRVSHRPSNQRDPRYLSAIRLAPLAAVSLDELSVPPRARRDPGRRRLGVGMLPGRQPHDSRRRGKLAPRMEADRRFQPGAWRR